MWAYLWRVSTLWNSLSNLFIVGCTLHTHQYTLHIVAIVDWTLNTHQYILHIVAIVDSTLHTRQYTLHIVAIVDCTHVRHSIQILVNILHPYVVRYCFFDDLVTLHWRTIQQIFWSRIWSWWQLTWSKNGTDQSSGSNSLWFEFATEVVVDDTYQFIFFWLLCNRKQSCHEYLLEYWSHLDLLLWCRDHLHGKLFTSFSFFGPQIFGLEECSAHAWSLSWANIC